MPTRYHPQVRWSLSPRELEILRRLAAGESTPALALSMGVQVSTVRTHVSSVLLKLGAHTRVEAVAIAVRLGLLERVPFEEPWPGGHFNDNPCESGQVPITLAAALPVRILIIDDCRILGQGLELLLRQHLDIESIDLVIDPSKFQDAITDCRPNVVLIVIETRNIPPIALISDIRRLSDPPAVVILTDNVDPAIAKQAVQAGAIGFVSMAGSAHDLIDAVDAAQRGVGWLPAGLLRALVGRSPSPSPSGSRERPLQKLTRREQEVLALLVSGLDRRAIAAHLYCSPETVRTHIRNVMSKLDVHSTVEAVAFGRRLGLHPE
jgi:DNA-binding NarL/FixJ family response regulator